MSTWILLVSLLLNGPSAPVTAAPVDGVEDHEGTRYRGVEVYLGKLAFERALRR